VTARGQNLVGFGLDIFEYSCRVRVRKGSSEARRGLVMMERSLRRRLTEKAILSFCSSLGLLPRTWQAGEKKRGGL